MNPKLLIIMVGILISLACLSTVQALVINSVSTSPSEIAPGESAIIEIEIENDWDESITDVSISLNLVEVPFAPYDSSSENSFDDIGEDKSKTVQFEIIALSDAKSGIYKIPIQVSFYDADENEHTKNSLISITVNSEPIIGVDVEDGLLLKGQENEINVKIVNKGLSDVRFLEVEVGSSTYFNILSQKNVYIGDVDSDDFDSAKFKIFFKENAPSTVNIPVSVMYKDVLNNKYTKDFNLQARVYTQKQAIELGLLQKSKIYTYAGAVASLVIIWLIYRKLKKRKKMKKAREAKEG